MKHLKRFNEINERHDDRPTYHRDRGGKFHSDVEGYVTELVALITNDGEVLNKKGFAEEGVGIFGFDKTEYPAGIAKNGEIYGSKIGPDDEILRLDTEEEIPGFKLGMIYKPTLENKDLDMTMDEKLNDMKNRLVNEIKDTFYIHYSMDNEDGDEHTTKILTGVIDNFVNKIKTEYRIGRIDKLTGESKINESDRWDVYEKAFNDHIAGKEVISDYEHDMEGSNYMFGLEVEGEYKYILDYNFDPQTSYIVDPDGEIIASNDNWNK